MSTEEDKALVSTELRTEGSQRIGTFFIPLACATANTGIGELLAEARDSAEAST